MLKSCYRRHARSHKRATNVAHERVQLKVMHGVLLLLLLLMLLLRGQNRCDVPDGCRDWGVNLTDRGCRGMPLRIACSTCIQWDICWLRIRPRLRTAATRVSTAHCLHR